MVQANVNDAAFQNGVQKLVFFSSSCICPRMAQQPMRLDVLITGTLEPTNQTYAIAEIAGIKLCESYNGQYGASHVISALVLRFHEATLSNGIRRGHSGHGHTAPQLCM